jgi:aspartyl-tRNA(Asn)/glutamyl-tRNA(Gln) amidotransferase subunit A
MNKFDGIRFKDSINSNTSDDITSATRTSLLGREVKRRIMLGNFVLSSEYYNDYYLRAKNMAEKIKSGFRKILDSNDLIFMPTTYGEAFELNSKTSDPVSMYIEDMFTVTANIIGMPAISIPVGKGSRGLPLGLQIVSAPFKEGEIYNMADFIMTHGGNDYE